MSPRNSSNLVQSTTEVHHAQLVFGTKIYSLHYIRVATSYRGLSIPANFIVDRYQTGRKKSDSGEKHDIFREEPLPVIANHSICTDWQAPITELRAPDDCTWSACVFVRHDVPHEVKRDT